MIYCIVLYCIGACNDAFVKEKKKSFLLTVMCDVSLIVIKCVMMCEKKRSIERRMNRIFDVNRRRHQQFFKILNSRGNRHVIR